ncbi:hypothetical protein GCM10027055_15920 [Janibacter alkaliphilus]|uniref:Ribosomal protein S18 acetylase RimI-like enzyme n=1 Tax=Janibacter alkaliphilus TaxID=1069963 RepID=A0A852X4P0_9MICO|nr:GNAT family N-acetyltransferase [Janibacter alkaliphilus]NYG37417.1 ribosomal protein S18 acetylase RimI-like enzyme [Janibacter alkaliphilus]
MTPRPPRPPLPRRRDRTAGEVPGPVEGSVVRPARAADIATIVTLHGIMAEAVGGPTEMVAAADWQQQAARWLQLHLADERVRVVVAEVHGVVVSCALGQVLDHLPSPDDPGEQRGLVSTVVTFPAHRRRGHSEACTRELLTWFREQTEVQVVELAAGERGVELYERLGFTAAEPLRLELRLDRLATENGPAEEG